MSSGQLGQRSITAFMWGGGGALTRLLMQTTSQIVLARLLGPEQYGLFAVGVLVISLSVFFSDVGIAYGLIQRPEIDDTHIRFVLTWQLILGTAVSLVLAALALPLADFFNDPRLVAVLLALAPLCLLQAASAVPLNLLKRALDFKALQLTQLGSFFLGYFVVGIPLALAGAGVWALVLAWAVQALALLVLLYRARPHALGLRLRHPDARAMGQFGGLVLLTNLLNWLIGSIDRAVVARSFETASVGVYSTAYNLVYAPVSALGGFMQPVMYAACARIQDDPERIRQVFLRLAAFVALAVMPVFVVIAVSAEAFVLTLYGTAWQQAAAVLQPIALAMPIYLLWMLTTPVLWNTGRAGLEWRMAWPLAVLWAVASWLGAQFSLVALAWIVAALYGLRSLWFIGVTLRILGLSVRAYVHALAGGLVASLTLAIAAWVLQAALADWPVARRLAAVVAMSALGVLLLLRVPGLVYPALAATLRAGLTQLPVRLARVLRAVIGPCVREP